MNRSLTFGLLNLARFTARDAMFLSLPQYEFPFPPDLDQPGSKHWTMVELTLHLPWFLLSAELRDAENADCRLIRTICIASAHDLADVLRSIDADRVTGIVGMMPAWQSANGQWTSRDIREVWMLSSDAGRGVLLVDADGQEFDGGLMPEHPRPASKELVLRVGQTNPREVPRDQRETPASATRRSRRADAHKAGA